MLVITAGVDVLGASTSEALSMHYEVMHEPLLSPGREPFARENQREIPPLQTPDYRVKQSGHGSEAIY